MRARLKLEVALLTAAGFVINSTYRMLYPFVAALARGMGVDLRSISLGVTALDAAGVFGPFLASTADSRGRKFAILLGAAVFSGGPLLLAFFPSYPTFLIAAVLIGVGVSATIPAVHAYLGDQVPYERRGLAISIFETNWSLAFIIGIPLIGLLIASRGWAAPFPILAGLALGMIALLAWALPRDAHPPAASNPLTNFRVVLAYGPALAGLLMAMAATAGNEIVNLTFGIYMGNRFGLQVAALGAAATVIGFAELGGEGLAAGFVDRLGKRRSIALGLAGNILAAALFLAIGRSLPGALVGLFLIYLSFEYTILSSISLMTEVYPAVRGTLIALNAAAMLLGRAMGAASTAPLYQGWGIPANMLAVVLLDLVALVLLRGVVVKKSAPAVEVLAEES